MIFGRKSSENGSGFGASSPVETVSIRDRFYEWRKQPHGREHASNGKMLANRFGFFLLGVAMASGFAVKLIGNAGESGQQVVDRNRQEINKLRNPQPTVTTAALGEAATAIVVECPDNVRIDVTDDATQQPNQTVGIVNSQITDPAVLDAILGAPFNAINDSFSHAYNGQHYFMPSGCAVVDPADGP